MTLAHALRIICSHQLKRADIIAQTSHRFWSEYGPAFGLSAAFLALSACLHIWWQSSPMTLPEDIWQEKLDYHLTYYPFAIRPFQTRATLLLHDLLSLPIRESFFAIQFSLTMCLGAFFYRFLRLLEFKQNWSLVGVALLMISYPILGAHFAPTHTWDDIWSYVFLVLAFSAVVGRRPVTAGVFITLGCFAREQILVFYPLLLLWAWWSRKEQSRGRLSVMLVAPLIVYGLYRLLVYEDYDLGRFAHLRYNFETVLRASDTVVSAWIAFGVLWITALIGLVRNEQRPKTLESKLVFWGVLIALPITFLLTISTGRARETRIFFPPFLFVIPLSLYELRDLYDRLRPVLTKQRFKTFALLVVVSISLGYGVAWLLFPEFDYGTNAEFRRQITGIHFGLSFLLLTALIAAWKKRKSDSR